MRVCQRWTLTPRQFDQLPIEEQIEMMAFVRYQDKQARQLENALAERRMLEPVAAALLTIHSL